VLRYDEEHEWRFSTIDIRALLMSLVFQAVDFLKLERLLHFDKLLSVGGTKHALLDYFKGVDKVEAVRRIFGKRTQEVLRNLKVEFTWWGGYMFVNSADGHIVVSSRYLNTGNRTDIYLDLIHELVHMRQFMEGKKLFDTEYSYVERPTEIEAYRHAVEEARRLGLSDERICEYLKTEWMSHEDFLRLARNLSVGCEGT
jgi:hypothetical protein